MKLFFPKLSFTKHPKSVGENYTQHMITSFSFSLLMLKGFFVCLIHALLPFCFEKTGSNIIKKLNENMVLKEVKNYQKKQPITNSAVLKLHQILSIFYYLVLNTYLFFQLSVSSLIHSLE